MNEVGLGTFIHLLDSRIPVLLKKLYWPTHQPGDNPRMIALDHMFYYYMHINILPSQVLPGHSPSHLKSSSILFFGASTKHWHYLLFY